MRKTSKRHKQEFPKRGNTGDEKGINEESECYKSESIGSARSQPHD